MRQIRYAEIADELRAACAGELGGVGCCPAKRSCREEFGASRVTVRRALELVREDGLIDARQGFGWFVATDPLRQRLDRLGTIEAPARRRRASPPSAGSSSSRFVVAPPRVAALLGVDAVLRVRRVNLADGEPFAASPCGARRRSAPSCHATTSSARPFYELLGVRLRGATQTIGADVAGDDDAELLEVPGRRRRCCAASGSRPTSDGRPVLVSEHVFPAHRTEFVVELPVRRALDHAERPAPRRVADLTTGPSAGPCRAARVCGRPHHWSQCRTVSSGSRLAGRKSVPIVNATGSSPPG